MQTNFNCTIQELKQNCTIQELKAEKNFNCTIQELKQNCTIQELKAEKFQLHHTGIKTAGGAQTAV